MALTSEPRAQDRWASLGKLLGQARACLFNVDHCLLPQFPQTLDSRALRCAKAR